MEFGNLFKNITDILTYIIPGYIMITLYGRITGQRIVKVDGIHILLYISISYLISNIINKFFQQDQIFICVIASIISGIIFGIIHKSIIKKQGGCLEESYPIDDLLLTKNDSVAFACITLKNKSIRYIGRIFLVSDDINPNYILCNYKIEILNQHMDVEGIIDTSKDDMYIYVKSEDIERVEFIFKQNTL